MTQAKIYCFRGGCGKEEEKKNMLASVKSIGNLLPRTQKKKKTPLLLEK